MRAPIDAGSSRDAAEQLVALGVRVIPIPRGSKAPRLRNWQQEAIALENLDQHFGGYENIGIVLGESSIGLVDVDIDDPLVKEFAHWLPATTMLHGRPSNPESHFWYLIDGEVPATTQFKAPDGTMLLELRSNGGQTVIPPSVYRTTDGREEQLVWTGPGRPGKASGAELLSAAKKMGAATLLAKSWPAEGSRHNASLAVAGMLLRNGWNDKDAAEFIEAVAAAASDEEATERAGAVASTRQALLAGRPVTGWTRLKTFVDEKVAARISEWLNVARDDEWDEPMLGLQKPRLPDLPSRLLPAPYGTLAQELSDATETAPALSIFSILSVVATAAATRFVVEPRPNWTESLNLYTLVALPPANNKSYVLSTCTAPLFSWEFTAQANAEPLVTKANSDRRNLESQISSQRAKATKAANSANQAALFSQVNSLEAQLKSIVVPAKPKLFVNDTTPESLCSELYAQEGRLAILSDEGGVLETLSGLYSKGAANIDVLTKGFDGGTIRIERKDRSIQIQPFLTIGLVAQPQVLRNLGEKKAFQGYGLQERFLFALPESKLGSRTLDGPPVTKATLDAYGRALMALLNVPAKRLGPGFLPTVLRLDDGASALWEQWRHEIEPKLREDGELSTCLGWGGKLAGTTLRLAGLVQLMSSGPASQVVDTGSMQAAIELARRLIPHALAAFGQMNDPPEQRLADRIQHWLIRQGILSVRRHDIFRAFRGGMASKKSLDDAMLVLQERCLVRQRERETTAGKRSTVFYDINPAALENVRE